MTEKTHLRERLAALEHEQWAHWTRHMLDHLTPENVERWRRQVATPYEALTETEKDSDREWADRVLEILQASEDPTIVRADPESDRIDPAAPTQPRGRSDAPSEDGPGDEQATVSGR